MQTRAQVGLAIGAGYILGRFHKMKWALALAGMGVGSKIRGQQGDLLRQGVKLVTSSPEMSNLTGELKGRLVEAGKSAATAAVSRRIGSLTDSLRDRGDRLRTPGGPGTQDADSDMADEAGEPGDSADDEEERTPADRPGPRRPKRSGTGTGNSGRERAARARPGGAQAPAGRPRRSEETEERKPAGKAGGRKPAAGSGGRKPAAGARKPTAESRDRPPRRTTSAGGRSAPARAREGRR